MDNNKKRILVKNQKEVLFCYDFVGTYFDDIVDCFACAVTKLYKGTLSYNCCGWNRKDSNRENDTISFFKGKFKNNDNLLFEYADDIKQAQTLLQSGLCDGVLEIVNTNDNPPIKSFLFYADNEPSIDASSDIKEQTKQIFKNSMLRVNYDMSDEDISQINNPKIDFYAKDIRTGESSMSEVKTVLGAIFAFIIYFFIFLFGGQVMRSVGEEKTSRIVEVLASSVKSVYLLFGKIIAVALLGLTQIVLWIVFTLLLVGGVSVAQPDLFSPTEQKEIQIDQRIVSVDAMDLSNTDSSL